MKKHELVKCILSIGLGILLMLTGCSKSESVEEVNQEPSVVAQESSETESEEETSMTVPQPQEVAPELPIYYTSDIEALDAQTSVETSYITDRLFYRNHFYIDENGVLWGEGDNQYGQLGIGVASDIGDPTAKYDEPVAIAENVIHVDGSEYGYFTVYLTANHELYGVGVNRMGVLREPVVEQEEEQPWRNPVIEPVLLMENVAFVSAGRESISVLTLEGDVYWWGRFMATTGTEELGTMSSEEPKLMVQNAVYTVCGGDSAAAIDADGQVWLWGCNVWGQCGTEGNDYEENAIKACDNVEMVWVESLYTRQNTSEPMQWKYDSAYVSKVKHSRAYTTFIRKNDGKIYACGIDLGGSEKKVVLYGNLSLNNSDAQSIINSDDYQRPYSTEFVPIQIEEADGQNGKM